MVFEDNIVLYFKKERTSVFAVFNEKNKSWDFISRKNFSFDKGLICLEDYNIKNNSQNKKTFFLDFKNGKISSSNKNPKEVPENIIEEIKKIGLPIENDFYVAYNSNIIKSKVSKENDEAVISYKVSTQQEINDIEDAKIYFMFNKERNSFIVKVDFMSYLGKKEVRINEYRIKKQELSFRDLYREHLNSQMYRLNELLPKSYEIIQDEKCHNAYRDFDEREKKKYQSMSNSKLISVKETKVIPNDIKEYIEVDEKRKKLLSHYKSKDGQSKNLMIYSDASFKLMSEKSNLVSYGILFRSPESDKIVLEYKEKEKDLEILDLIKNNVNLSEFVGCLKSLELIKEKKYKKDIEVKCDNLITVAMLDHFFNNKDNERKIDDIYKLFLEKNDSKYIEEEKLAFKAVFDRFDYKDYFNNISLNFFWVKGHKNDVYNKRVDFLASKYDSNQNKTLVFEDDTFFKNKIDNKKRLRFS